MAMLGAIVAPTTFQVLQAADPVSGRALAGAVFGTVLSRFHFVAYGCGFLLLVSLVAMALLGPRPKAFAIRFGLVAAMLGVALYSGVFVLGEIDQIQQAVVGGLPSKLPDADPRHIRFDALHQLSTRLMLLNVIGAVALLYWEVTE